MVFSSILLENDIRVIVNKYREKKFKVNEK